MNRKFVSGVMVALFAVGTVVSPLGNVSEHVKDERITVSAESKEAVKLDADVMHYEGLYRESRQIPCEALGGIYFLNGEDFVFYSLDTKKASLVHTFENICGTYVTEDKLYVLTSETSSYSHIIVYDLNSQKVEKTLKINQRSTVIGVDNSGRIYLAGASGDAYAIYLLSPDGELLSQTTSKQPIYEFGGFDSTNGNFYVDSYDNWIYWGYEHDMHALRAGNVSGTAITFDDELCMQLIAQSYYYNRQNQLELLGNKYICVDSTFQNCLQIWDSNAYSVTKGEDTRLISFGRDNAESGKFDNKACVGVRAVYKEDTDSLIVFKDNSTIAEYNINTREEVASVSTSYPVFSLMKYKEGVVAIEKENSDFYYEYFPWKNATMANIHGTSSNMKVGESLVLTASTNGSLDEVFTWTSSNSKVASVTQSGKVLAWSKGTATISIKSKTGLSAEYVITVLGDSLTQTPKEHTVVTTGEKTNNASANDYEVWSSIMNSYLVENADGTLARIEYKDKKIIIETYSKDGSVLQSSKTLEAELELFGGFYSGSDYNYFVFGSTNEAESDACEVLRVVKYSKDWNRIASVSANGINTHIPFDAGSLRMTEKEGKLYIYTCHEMYASDDGYHHQSNMTFVVNEGDFTMEQSYYDVMNIAQAGYVSHSFNQFIRSDGKYIYRVDHGDSNPRAISITRCKVGDSIQNVIYTLPVNLSKVYGYNQTGASIGGFELSSENCVIAGNAVDVTVSGVSSSGMRNIFVSLTSTKLGQSDMVWLTDYDSNKKVEVRTPHLVKVGTDSFLVMWEEYYAEEEKTYTELLTVDGSGNITSDQVTTDMRLSDCEPILCSDGLVRWYAAEKASPVMYTVNPFDLKAAHTHHFDNGTITKEATCTESGTKTYRCKNCSETKEEEIPVKEHSYDSGTITKEATCTETGTKTYRCKNCSAAKTEEIPAKGHSYDKGNITKQPTVDAEGEKIYTCIDCGETKVEVVEKVVPIDLSKVNISGISDKVYTGKEIKQTITLNVNGTILKENTDYTISYNNNIEVGKAAVTVEGMGNYKGTITQYFKIKPQAVTLASVKSSKKAQIKVTWKKVSQVDGYQIVYATDRTFTKGKHSVNVGAAKVTKTISKLSKGKKYYVKVRAYKTVEHKKIYGGYSKAKTVTVKRK